MIDAMHRQERDRESTCKSFLTTYKYGTPVNEQAEKSKEDNLHPKKRARTSMSHNLDGDGDPKGPVNLSRTTRLQMSSSLPVTSKNNPTKKVGKAKDVKKTRKGQNVTTRKPSNKNVEGKPRFVKWSN